ncbi:hypothetical protein [Pelagerythrobacter rhizovicinus]|uniref:hypothetical protein n=1 Tax=Pelagerythrobacter rhizovicinus TaxID=2268576 RepID=UPI0013EB194D|nr:hypothetical protein [Pelagerythrobacter rhizovicinus]
MTDFDTLRIVSLIGWLAVATAAYASFRLDLKKSLRMALVWIAIFVGVAFVFSLIGR